ncbi:MAG: ribosome small subunit-dependent GTPase A [Vampirovibrionales bacterium]|nr:ribosome small subunit-dependent GTPase A [Vampirovibrionales bacterium]
MQKNTGADATDTAEMSDILVGDWVTLDSIDEANKTARIVEIEPRQNALARPKIANVDQALIVYPLKQPEFDPHSLNRFLTHIALAKIPAIICFSKSDLLDSPERFSAIESLYGKTLGFPIAFVSVYQPDTLKDVTAFLEGKVTVLAGPSGAGKSSLLNALQPDLQLKVGEVSEKIERGQHTTRHTELLALGNNTFIADTPGFSYLKFDQTLPEQLVEAYCDFKMTPVETACAYKDCLHLPKQSDSDDSATADTTTQHCAFLDDDTHAPKPGLIDQSRYDTYCAMMSEALSYKAQSRQSSQKQESGFKRVSSKGKSDRNILRLSGKSRESSRRTQRQELLAEHHQAQDELEKKPD